MNIFSAMTKGNGRLQEPNVSSLLAFFLDPNEVHNLNTTFLQEFISALTDYTGENINFDLISHIEVTLEERVVYDSTLLPRYVDIVLRLYAEDRQLLYIIAIENKINKNAADTNQFLQEFIGIEKKIDALKTKIIMVFLTPDSDFQLLEEEFNNLDDTTLGSNQKVWMKWADNGKSKLIQINEYLHFDGFMKNLNQRPLNSVTKDDLLNISKIVHKTHGYMIFNSEPEEITVVDIFRKVLTKESLGQINPVNEYEKHTIKAFIHFIETKINKWIEFPNESQHKMYYGIDINSVDYNLVLEDEFSIQYTSSGNVVSNQSDVWDILNQIIEQEKLGIDNKYPSGGKKKIPQLGREVLRALMGDKGGFKAHGEN